MNVENIPVWPYQWNQSNSPGEFYYPFGNTGWSDYIYPNPKIKTEVEYLEAIQSNWKIYVWIPWVYYANSAFRDSLLIAFLNNIEVRENPFFRDCLIEVFQKIKYLHDPNEIYFWLKFACARGSPKK